MTFLLTGKVNEWYSESTTAKIESSTQTEMFWKLNRDQGQSTMPNLYSKKQNQKF